MVITSPARLTTSILELLGFSTVVGVIAISWRAGQDCGIMVAIISLACTAYYFNRLRSQSPIVPTTLIALPVIAIGVFVIALAFGLRHPPLLVPPDWEWPPFASLRERMIHAFALSIWTFIFGTPTILIMGIVRRLIRMSNVTPDDATNNPMNPSRGSAVS